jgi:hypothetical protein
MLSAASGALLAVLGLGLGVCHPLWGRRPLSFQSLGACFAAGILSAFLAGLASPSLTGLLHFGWILALPGLLLACLAARRQGVRSFLGELDTAGAVIFALAVTGIAVRVLAEPLSDWDARSIWYFHAKIIYYADRLLTEDSWVNPTMEWARLDYPKLNAFLAALWSRALGGWNDLDPKASLILLNVPVVLLAIGFTRSNARRLLLVAILTLKGGNLLWDGRMDGLLAAYAGLGALYGGRFAKGGDKADFAVALLAAGLVSGLKNEGTVLALLILLWTLAAAWVVQHREGLRRLLSVDLVPLAAAAALPAFIWVVWKQRAGIVSEYVATGGAWSRISGRLADGDSLPSIIANINRPKEVRALAPFLLTLLVVAVLPKLRKNGRWVQLVPPLAVALCYLAVLVMVYLSTPWDLAWQLKTSARRTVQPIFVCLTLGIVGLLRDD